MKQCIMSCYLMLCSIAFAGEVETINLKGDDYLVSKELPQEIIGLYKYEWKGEPIIQINSDNTGLFQPHGVPAIPIKTWIHVDANGEPHRQVGTPQRYRYTLLVQYGEGGDGNYPAGGYDLLGITILRDEGRASILGERFRSLN